MEPPALRSTASKTITATTMTTTATATEIVILIDLAMSDYLSFWSSAISSFIYSILSSDTGVTFLEFFWIFPLSISPLVDLFFFSWLIRALSDSKADWLMSLVADRSALPSFDNGFLGEAAPLIGGSFESVIYSNFMFLNSYLKIITFW
jgi:hypothetical protein